MKNKLMLMFVLGMFLFSFVSATETNQGVGTQGETFTITQTCGNANYITIGAIQLPDRSSEIINANMTFVGSGVFQYNYTNTDNLGRYDVSGISDGCDGTFAFYFDITPSGSPFTESLSLPVFLPMIIMFLLAIFFFFLTHYVEKEEYKWTFLILGGIFFVFSLSYGIVASREVLYGFPLLYAFINGFYKVFIVLLRVLAILIPIVVMFFVIRRAFSSRGYDVGGFKK